MSDDERGLVLFLGDSITAGGSWDELFSRSGP